VRTADTGQVDATTVALPANNSVGGFSVWRANDALQATTPIFLRIEFTRHTTGDATNSPPGYSFQAGTATDGAGNLTGVVSSKASMDAWTGSAAFLKNAISAADGRIACMLHINGSPTAGSTHRAVPWFVIERSRDGLGNFTDEGFFFMTGSTLQSTQVYQFIPRVGSAFATSGLAVPWPHNLSAAMTNGDALVAPIFPCRGRLLPPLKAAVVIGTNEFALDSLFTVNHYGENKTYRALASQKCVYRVVGGATAYDSTGFAFLWE
jgi:hypothetical protein